MDDAPLQAAVGIHSLDGLHHAAQAVSAEQINIQNAPAFEVIQHIQPKFAALMFPNPHAQDVFSTVHGDAQHHVGYVRLVQIKNHQQARRPLVVFSTLNSPCELEMDLMILQEAELESMEVFYAMREELQFYLKRTQLLEAILTENNIPVPEYDD